jgi:hypothetical protein
MATRALAFVLFLFAQLMLMGRAELSKIYANARKVSSDGATKLCDMSLEVPHTHANSKPSHSRAHTHTHTHTHTQTVRVT